MRYDVFDDPVVFRQVFFFSRYFRHREMEHASFDDAVDFDKIAHQEYVINETHLHFRRIVNLKMTYLNIHAFLLPSVPLTF